MSLGDHPTGYPSHPMRCEYCRLVIGAGRARDVPEASEFGARAHSSAAGMLASSARRADGDVLDHSRVADALRRVASRQGCALDRLRMLDYETHAKSDETLPALADVLATFGGWKKARRAAEYETATGLKAAA
jgi:hypothetical protein